MRLFVGIAFDQTVKTRLEGVCAQLRSLGCSGSYTHSDNLHLTLKFLGETDRSKLPSLRSAMNTACRGAGAFEIIAARLDSFRGGSGGDRLAWLGVEQSEALHALYDRLEDVLSAIGYAKESRPFHPHLTLVRRAGVPAALFENAGLQHIVIPVNEATLFESTRVNGVLRYLPLYHVGL